MDVESVDCASNSKASSSSPEVPSPTSMTSFFACVAIVSLDWKEGSGPFRGLGTGVFRRRKLRRFSELAEGTLDFIGGLGLVISAGNGSWPDTGDLGGFGAGVFPDWSF